MFSQLFMRSSRNESCGEMLWRGGGQLKYHRSGQEHKSMCTLFNASGFRAERHNWVLCLHPSSTRLALRYSRRLSLSAVRVPASEVGFGRHKLAFRVH